ncbi:MAG: hypothetical protein QM731_09695 [Chitinophagaceae bacterium]
MATLELTLIKAIIAHNTSALEVFYCKYSSMLYGFLLAALDNPTQAETVLHQVFSELPVTLKSYSPQLLSPYIFLQQKAREKIRTLNLQQPQAQDQPLPTLFVHKQQYFTLSSEDQELFNLCFYKGFTLTDIALAKGWTLEEARVRCRQALVKFNNYISAKK